MNTTDTRENLTFDAWYRKVDGHVASICGLGVDDLADGASWDSWDSCVSPAEYAEMLLEDNDFPFD